MNTKNYLKIIISYSIFLSLLISTLWISIPFSAVPFTFQVLFIFLIGLFLGPIHGFFCIAIYLLMGALGLPVFANYTGGINYLIAQPTAGFLWGFLFLAFFTGLGSKLAKNLKSFNKIIIITIFALIGQFFLYFLGIIYLSNFLNISYSVAIKANIFFFIVDWIKYVFALVIFLKLEKNFFLK